MVLLNTNVYMARSETAGAAAVSNIDKQIYLSGAVPAIWSYLRKYLRAIAIS